MPYISKSDLEPGELYECDARNFRFGFWDGTSFTYIRIKFSSAFIDQEYHWDDGPPHGTVKPYRKIERTDYHTMLRDMNDFPGIPE